MDEHMEPLYREARRFDEGEVYQTEEYSRLARLRGEHYDALCLMLGPGFTEIFSQFIECVDEIAELECLHFFTEGYKIGKREGEAGKL